MTAVMNVIRLPTPAETVSQSPGRDRRVWLVALPWIGVPIVVVSGVVLPVGLHLQALALSACAGVGLLLSRLAVRETCQSFEQKLKELRFAQEDLLERMIAYGEANEGTTCEDMRVIRNICDSHRAAFDAQ